MMFMVLWSSALRRPWASWMSSVSDIKIMRSELVGLLWMHVPRIVSAVEISKSWLLVCASVCSEVGAQLVSSGAEMLGGRGVSGRVVGGGGLCGLVGGGVVV